MDLTRKINQLAEKHRREVAYQFKTELTDNMQQTRSYSIYANSTTKRRSGETVVGANRDIVDTQNLLHSVHVDLNGNVVSDVNYAALRLEQATGLVTNTLDSFKYKPEDIE